MFLRRLLVSLAIPAVICAAPTLPSGEHKDIVGGSNAGTAEFPFIVTLLNNNIIFCGGILLNADTVVTAAHCVVTQEVHSTSIRAGSNSWYMGGIVAPVHRIIIRPGYKRSNMIGDIAILKLTTPILPSSTISYATLARHGFRPGPGTSLIAAGWGALNKEDLWPTNTLRKAHIPVITQEECASLYETSLITGVQFCAMDPTGKKDTCNGDSGGPIMDSHNVVVGISSWGKGCGSPDSPGVYTNIGSFHKFIDEYSN